MLFLHGNDYEAKELHFCYIILMLIRYYTDSAEAALRTTSYPHAY